MYKYGVVVQCTVRARFVVYVNIELSDSNISEEKDGGDTNYPIDSPLDGSELISLSEVVSEIPIVELASTSLQFKHYQCYFGFFRV